MAIPRLKTSPKYTDAPRFELIYQYEGKAKASYKKHLYMLAKSLSVIMKENLGL